jgi:adenosine deaminase
MLAFQPDRIGHMCFLDESLDLELSLSRVPVELCLSSNVITESMASYAMHHFAQLYKAGHPVVLCTDELWGP